MFWKIFVINKKWASIGTNAARSESSVRSGVRVLLSKRYLDWGKSSAEILLLLTSRGRLLLLAQ